MKIHFQLLKQGKSNPTIILKVYDSRFKDRFCKVSTGRTIPIAHWDKNKERTKGIIAKAKEYNALNSDLDALEQIVIEFRTNNRHQVNLSRTALRNFIQLKSRPAADEIVAKSDTTFFAQWEKMIDEAKNSKGSFVTKSTRKSKMQTLNLIQKFATSKKLELHFHLIDMGFYNEFDAFMHSLNLTGNSRGKHFKEIKAIMREAIDRGLAVNTAFQKKSFKVIRTEPESIFLNDEEIRKLLQLKLAPNLEQLRDIFVMACFVGARYSDWHQIHKKNIVVEKGREILKISQQKVGEITHVPVHPVVRMILNKYGENPPKVISNQKFNDGVKVICKAADLGVITIEGEVVEKWRAASTHTARRSFATNAYLSKSMDVFQIMKCTGHKTESSFLRYLRLKSKDFAIQAADSSFFTNNSYSMAIEAKPVSDNSLVSVSNHSPVSGT